MKLTMKIFCLGIVLFGSVCTHAPVTGEKVFEDFIKVTGGKDAYGKIRNSVTKSTLELANGGLKMEITSYLAIPNLSYSVIESTQGKIESGFNGEVAWEISPQGARIKENEEMWMQANFSRIDFAVKWRDILKEIRLEDEEFFKGESCYVITLIPKQGPSVTSYYSKKSKLMIQSSRAYKSSKGEVSYIAHSIKYKKFKGILIDVQSKLKIAENEFTITTNSVKFNVKISKDRFKLPEAIRALLDKKRGARATL